MHIPSFDSNPQKQDGIIGGKQIFKSVLMCLFHEKNSLSIEFFHFRAVSYALMGRGLVEPRFRVRGSSSVGAKLRGMGMGSAGARLRGLGRGSVGAGLRGMGRGSAGVR